MELDFLLLYSYFLMKHLNKDVSLHFVSANSKLKFNIEKMGCLTSSKNPKTVFLLNTLALESFLIIE